MSIRLVARCVRGLESIVAADILRLGLGKIFELGHREIHFEQPRPHPATTRLWTADDVFVLVGCAPDIGSTKDSVAALEELAAALQPRLLRESRCGCGGPDGFGSGVEVSASFLGRRNFNRYDVEDVVGRALARRLGLRYHTRRNGTRPPESCSAWRVHLDGTRARLLLRLADRPLHRRAYKQHTIPGTLHPPLASAMAHLADIRPGNQVLDPCCGAGTLLIEASLLQPTASYTGFDLNPTAIQAAQRNITTMSACLPPAQADSAREHAGTPRTPAESIWLRRGSAAEPAHGEAEIRRADAGELPLREGSVDRVVCNPPWGEQVLGRGLLAGDSRRLWGELRRVVAAEGIAVVLVPDPGELAAAVNAGFAPTYVQQVRVSGRQSFLVRLTPQHAGVRRNGKRSLRP
ncbi:methyltransferase domain-containing protein [Nocardia transvalensis]|uniref:methyltransferase domain-containing protein n=1 Tax=Nocardia transvalensis TaxID=37333 RepID=UPI001895E1A7|nr:methyltransferase domain-containing protein [Nocardia transvalensis]MBF6329591.1 methyltransferase domain-containing protein [Nocardia transvalensis]